MSKPTDPIRWANLETNYPAGTSAWSATPVRVAFAADYYTPGAPATAQEANYLFGSTTDYLKTIVDELGYGLNWRDPVSPTGNDVIGSAPRENYQTATWDARNSRWLALVRTAASNDLELMYSPDGGRTWADVGGVGLNISGYGSAILPDSNPNVSVINAFTTASNRGLTFRQDLGVSTTWTAVNTFVNANATRSELRMFAGLYISLFSGAAAYSSTDGVTWTSRTIPALGTLGTAADWAVAVGASVMVAFQRAANAPDFMTTTNGTTWTGHTLTGTNATETLESVTYAQDPGGAGGYFLAAIYDSTIGGTRFISSTDGVTWTNVVIGGTRTHLLGGGIVTDVCAFGTVVLAVEEYGDRSAKVYLSTNSGKDWRITSGRLSDNISAGGAPYQRPRIYASPTGLLAINAKVSLASLELGLPAVASSAYYP